MRELRQAEYRSFADAEGSVHECWMDDCSGSDFFLYDDPSFLAGIVRGEK